MDSYQTYIFKSRYARYIPEEQRRETWEETVSRYVYFWVDKGLIDDKVAGELYESILKLDVMPSMRALMTAGEALDRDNVAGFNCSYLPIDHPRAFDELMYILMCGTGVGFSVERQYVNKLPDLPEELYQTDTVIVVDDSKIGWAKAYRELISLLYSGQIPQWDVSQVRPSGAPLRTFGGRASGPDPLVDLFQFTIGVFRRAEGPKLTSIECHDICNKVGEIVVVGGVRRSAQISLSNLSDDRMRRAKQGQWWVDNPQRALANNSACYTERPNFEVFLEEWKSLYESKSGERGIFSRVASQRQAARNGRRDSEWDFGTNPCSEIILRPNQFCNLSEVVVRPSDAITDLERKVRTATILGTLQATLTDFRYLRSAWKNNTEEEALLGVSLTGIMDHPVMNGSGEGGTWFDHPYMPDLPKVLERLRTVAVETNKEWAAKCGIAQSAAITCVKPSGTVSQLVNSSSGIHGRFSPFYIRRVRADKKDPLSQVLIESGVPYENDVMNSSTYVFSFPQKSPSTSVMASEQTALEQLNLWKIYQEHWCEHKPSITVYYRDSEFLAVGDWVYNNFDIISGISFLPYSEHTYKQAPYESISEDAYLDLVRAFPVSFTWNIQEDSDKTEGSQTLACTAGGCEI